MRLTKEMRGSDPICDCDHVLSDHKLEHGEADECLISGCDCGEFSLRA